jgi:hypothetical protein
MSMKSSGVEADNPEDERSETVSDYSKNLSNLADRRLGRSIAGVAEDSGIGFHRRVLERSREVSLVAKVRLRNRRSSGWRYEQQYRRPRQINVIKSLRFALGSAVLVSPRPQYLHSRTLLFAAHEFVNLFFSQG